MNITRTQLVSFLGQLAESARHWNMAQDDGDRGPGNDPIILVVYDDGSGVIGSCFIPTTTAFTARESLNVQHEFSSPEEAADYLIDYHQALD
ncbi:MAG TPA: hypothetical protein VHQ01_12210 [Pyrinomonadaceae bacterium]|jgi:hypothetical protein|nr:hypothetical protein [Pyrinomonadaceae bacterium]